jgi:hypothetical protein
VISGAKVSVAVFVLAVFLSCQSSAPAGSKASPSPISIPDLGLKYTPVAGMQDETSASNRQLRENAAAYATKAAQPILELSSDDADTKAEWHRLLIFIFPRAQLSALNDAAAEGKINTALAGPRAVAAGQPHNTNLGGRNFLVSEFEQSEPPLLKHAKVYTTICKTELVSFVLVSNSAEPMKGMEESLKSLSFSPN